jgi:hypothetical protein
MKSTPQAKVDVRGSEQVLSFLRSGDENATGSIE